MKNLVLIFLLFIFELNVFSQNLITNPSFEDIDSCFGGTSPIGFDVFQWTGCTGWYCPTDGSSDLWCENPIFGPISPPNILGVGYQYPHSGNNFGGILIYEMLEQNYREYISNILLEPLESGQYYQFSVFVSTNEDSLNYSSCLQAYFSTNLVTSSDYYFLPLNPQWKNDPENFIRDTLGWQYVTGLFKANGGEKYVTIGCFDDSASVVMFNINPNTSSDLYYFLDDVSLIKAPIEINFPNVFTPNEDGVNDFFTPIVIGIPDYEVYVYNRWGNLMTKLDLNSPSWDGKDATEAVYFYLMRSKELGITEQGFFQLIR